MLKTRIYKIIEPAENNDLLSKIFDNSILLLIVINIVSIVLESFSGISEKYGNILSVIEGISIVIFTIEYLLRITTSDLHYHERSKIKSIFKYVNYLISVRCFIKN